MLILTIVQLDIILEFYFILFFFSFHFVYISACHLVFAFVCVITVKVIVSVCEDGVKLNYFYLILNQKEPNTLRREQREAHQRNLATM